MAIGRPFVYEEQQQPSGEVTHRLVPFEQIGRGESRQADMRQHYTLSGTYGASDPLRLVAGRPVVIRSPLPFTKFRIMVRDTGVVAYIGIGRMPGTAPGQYDDVIPGGNILEDRCDANEMIAILVDVTPGTPVDVFLYAGEPAKSV